MREAIFVIHQTMHVGHHNFSADHPEWAAKIHDLKMSDQHFASLIEEHERLDKEIVRLEEDDDNTLTDGEMEDLKKKRLRLADEIISRLA